MAKHQHAKTPSPRKGRDPDKPPGWYCDGHNRGGELCGNRAGKGTDHPGVGKCKNHGGATPSKHGRYSKIQRPRISELIAQFEADPDPLNLLPEVALLRALVLDYIERFDQTTQALLDWHASWGSSNEKAKPGRVPDILTVGRFISDIGHLVERIQKQRQEGSVTLSTLNRVMEQLGVETMAAVQEVISDAATRTTLLDLIEQRWGTIRIDAGKPGPSGAA